MHLSKNKKIESNFFLKNEDKHESLPIYRLLDPYQYYKLHGDIVLPNEIWQGKNETIYPLELHREYKFIRQIHFRQHGIIFELDEFDENYITPILFLKNRLESLGDKNAHSLSIILENYLEFFKKLNNSSNENELTKVPSNCNLEPKVFDWIDGIFELNKENILFLKGNKIKENKDFSAKYLCYNFQLLEWLTNESNIFSEEFITDCFRFTSINGLEGFTAILKNVVQIYKNNIKQTVVARSFNTIIGKINILMKFETFSFPLQGLFFQYGVHSKEYFDPLIEEKILKNKMEIYSKRTKFTICKQESQNHVALMKLYYEDIKNK